jgi:short-subunit dehydrogenase
MNPHNRIILITGASSGIGAAAARAFDAAGASVVLAARNAEALHAVAAGLRNQPLVIPTDVSAEAQVQAAVAQIIEKRGRIDILLNNAGVGLAGPVESLRPEDLARTLAIDLLGPLHTIQAVVPHMRHQKRGQIINISSVLSAQVLPYLGGYAAAKAALDRLSEALRIELQGTGIAVTVFRPGTTRTSFRERRLGQGHEQRRIAPRGVPPERVAAALVQAAHREPRIAYTTLSDRLTLWAAAFAPAIVERMLGRSISWQAEKIENRE